MTLQNVCLVGANGTLGTAITKALVSSSSSSTFTISILRRQTSASPPAPAGVTEIPVSPSLTLAELTTALQGQHAVIAAFPLTDVTQHLRLVQAAHDAGVSRYIPADYGSCDAASPRPQQYLQLYRDKTAVRARCEELAAASPGACFSWTSIICGHFFDHGLEDGLLHFDLAEQTALILDTGRVRASTSTLSRVADAVVRVLQHPDQAATRNRALYIQSFCPSQLEILAALERATGRTWKTQHVDSADFLETASTRLAEGNKAAVEDIVFVLGTVDADWRGRDGFAMELLGLEDEDLDAVVARVVREHEGGKKKQEA
ncbi:hypothetical protein E4U43_001268 [Claviceps pusilla]|uniref:NmrA-like domain-containing protein n=1 Tax=Claviceps pusilla TaxID=123648 RepID=A0A9P7N8T8_9HYPO|nr:hypothetical protein E4U43_001268 [Claviceps pusilla]